LLFSNLRKEHIKIMFNVKRLIKNHGVKVFAMFMAVVLTVTGITISQYASASDFPTETGKKATLSYTTIISGRNDFYQQFGNHSLQNITLTAKKGGNTSSAFCIAPGVGIKSGSTYTSGELPSSRIKKYYKAAIYYFNSSVKDISNGAKRTVTQLFVWRIYKINKVTASGKSITSSMLTSNSPTGFKTVVKNVLKDKYGYSDAVAEAAYKEAKSIIFDDGEDNLYKDTVSILKWDDGSGQSLITGTPIELDRQVRVKITKSIIKKDGTKLSNGRVEGCVFRVYSEYSCKKGTEIKDDSGKIATITIGSNGVGYSNYMTFPSDDKTMFIYVKEYSAPDGSKLNTEIEKISIKNVKDGEKVTVEEEYENEGWYGKVRVEKKDSTTDKNISGAVFTIYEWNASQSQFVSTGKTLKSTASGYSAYSDYLYYTKSNLGKFRLVETTVPDGYIDSNCYRDFTISEVNDEPQIPTVYNTPSKQGRVQVNKISSVTKEYLSGATFSLYKWTGTGKATATSSDWTELGNLYPDTETEGVYYRENLELGNSYMIVEQKFPLYYNAWSAGYGGGKPSKVFTLDTDNASATFTITNDPIEVSIGVVKKDKDTKETLEGAVIELWETDENGTLPVDNTADEETEESSNLPTLVSMGVTDADGNVTFENLDASKYYIVKEAVAPDNYSLDEDNNTIFINDLAERAKKLSTVETSIYEQVSFENEKISCPIIVHKKSSSRTGGESKAVSGATFSIYDVTELISDSFDYETYDYSSMTPVATMTTDDNGDATSNNLEADRTYVSVETGVPNNLLQCENKLIELTASDVGGYEYEAIDVEFASRLKIQKKDKSTGNIINLAGMGFKIYSVDKGKYITQTVNVPDEENPDEVASSYETDTFYTDEEGICKLPDVLDVGEYEIQEVEVRGNYVVNKEAVSFVVDSNSEYELDPDSMDPMITVDFYNDPVTGYIELTKTGETVTSFDDEKGFVYEKTSLEGVSFTLKAAEDIYAEDMSGDLLYEKDEIIESKLTNENGKITFKNVPIGNYVIYETDTVSGYVINSNEIKIAVEYKDENTSVVKQSLSVTNDRQKVDIKVTKKDEDTEEVLQGAVFGIYAANDIKDKDGKVVVEKNKLIEKGTTNEHGVVHFGTDLDYPATDFILKEIKAPKGYATNDEEVQITALEAPQNTSTIEREYVVYDKVTTTEISKTDITSGDEVIGATLKVWYTDDSGYDQTVDEWVSTNDKHIIQGLEVGKEYTLTEKVPADGYVTASDIKFTIQDTGEIQSVEMKDDYTKVEISKSDITTGKSVIGAKLSILDMDGNNLYSWTTTEEDYYIEKLPIGQYILREEIAPTEHGYTTAEDVTFEVKDTGEIQTVEMKDDYTKVEIFKKSLSTGENLANCKLRLEDENGKLIESWITGTESKAFERLAVGKYTLIEEDAVEGYMLAEPITFEVKDSPDTLKVIMYDEEVKGQISLTKVDNDNDEITLAGAVFTVYNENGDKVTTLVSDENGIAKSAKLPLGVYIVKETDAPSGYNKTSKTWEVHLEASKNKKNVVAIDLGKVTNKKKTTLITPKTGEIGNGAKISVIVLLLLAGVITAYVAISSSDEEKEKQKE
jgi:hypothetical protein